MEREREPTAATPSAKPKQTAKRTSNFRPWAITTSMSPASTSVSPQDSSPVKITNDVPSSAKPRTQDSSLKQKATMLKEGGLSMTARIMQAQKQWEAKQDHYQWPLSNEGQGEAFAGSNSASEVEYSGLKSESPAADTAHKAKPAQESPVPLPSYAQHAPATTKRSAPDSDSDIDTPAAKRQQAMVRDNDTGISNPPGSGILARTPVPRNVNVNGRIMEVIDMTGERKYSEYWITSEDGTGKELVAAGGGLLPSEYQKLDTDDHPWVCPVRDCRKRLSTLKGLRGHVFPSHKGMAFNDNKDGTISEVGIYKNLEEGKTSPPVIVSCDPISPNAQPARKPWKVTTQQKQPQPVTSLSNQISLPNQAPSLISTSATEDYLLQFLSSKQEERHRPDIDFMRYLPRKRDLPEAWLRQHNGDSLKNADFAAALAYLVGEEVTGSGRCGRDLTRPTSRLSEKCIKLPSNMPLTARACFSKTPTCVGCQYRANFQRQANDCDWHPDRRTPGEKPRHRRASTRARLPAEEEYSSVRSSTAESDGPVDTSVAETERPSDSEMDSDAPQEQADRMHTAAMEIDDAYAGEKPATQLSIRPEGANRVNPRSRQASAGLRKEGIPRMQEWECNEGRLFDSSGQWAVAWSAPYNTGRDAFQIAPNISTHRIRLGPGDKHSWSSDQNTFRDATVLSGEIDLKMNDASIGTLTQGSIFKVQPGDSCTIQNCCVEEASLFVHVVGNFLRLAAD